MSVSIAPTVVYENTEFVIHPYIKTPTYTCELQKSWCDHIALTSLALHVCLDYTICVVMRVMYSLYVHNVQI